MNWNPEKTPDEFPKQSWGDWMTDNLALPLVVVVIFGVVFGVWLLAGFLAG